MLGVLRGGLGTREAGVGIGGGPTLVVQSLEAVRHVGVVVVAALSLLQIKVYVFDVELP